MRVFVTGLVAALVFATAGSTQAGVVPPHSTVDGKTIGEWTAEWWKWALSFEDEENPILDPTGEFADGHQDGPVFFVPGSNFGLPQPVNRTFTVPGDKYLLIPLINWIVGNGTDDPAFADTREEAIALASGTVNPRLLFLIVDGRPIHHLGLHRENSADFFTVTQVGIFSIGDLGQTYDDCFADGYWIMLEPLGEGHHVLHFGGTTRDYTSPTGTLVIDSYELDITSMIGVGP
jgi:hypothetical protein